MEQQFYTILTKVGKAKIANSNVLNTKLNLTKFQVGDGGGAYYNPIEDQTKLKNKVWEGNINSIRVDKDNPSWIVIEVVIPSNEGGFMIREAGIMDDEGNLIAVGKYPETFKPHIDNGSSKDLFIRMILEVSNTQNVTLKVDPTIIMATKKDIEVLESRVKGLEDRVSEIETGLKDNTLTVFKTDALSTKLEGCAGGFVNIDSIKGETLINLFQAEEIRFGKENNTYTTFNILNSTTSNKVMTIINPTNKKIIVDIYEKGEWKRAVGVTDYKAKVITTATESVWVIYGFINDGWTDINKNELKKVMILEGEWTNKSVPDYFEGIKSTGEEILGNNLNLPMNEVFKNPMDMGGLYYTTSRVDNNSGSSFNTNTLGKHLKIINKNDKRIRIDIYLVDKLSLRSVFVLANSTLDIKINNDEIIPCICGLISDGWNDSNKNQLKSVDIKEIISYKIEIISSNNNLVPNSEFEDKFMPSTIIGANAWRVRRPINENEPSVCLGEKELFIDGVVAPNSDIHLYMPYKIKLKPNTKYTFSYYYRTAGEVTNNSSYIFIGSDIKAPNQSVTQTAKLWRRAYITFTTNTTNLDFIYRFGFRSSGYAWMGVTGIQLEEGDLNDYNQHKEDRTEILIKEPLRSIKGFAQDLISDNGEIIRACGESILSGNEDWSIYGSVENQTDTMLFFCKNPLFANVYETDGNCISDRFKGKHIIYKDEEGITQGNNNNHIFIRINKSRLTTKDVIGFKQWLSQNPVTAIYQLATPTIEDKSKTFNLRSYDNLIINAGAVQPEVSYSYAKNIGERIITIEDAVEDIKSDAVNNIKDKIILLNGIRPNESWDIPCINYSCNIASINCVINISTIIKKDSVMFYINKTPVTNCIFKLQTIDSNTTYDLLLERNVLNVRPIKDIPPGVYIINVAYNIE